MLYNNTRDTDHGATTVYRDYKQTNQRPYHQNRQTEINCSNNRPTEVMLTKADQLLFQGFQLNNIL